MTPRDWDKELAKIDKLMGQEPAPATGDGGRAALPAGSDVPSPVARREAAAPPTARADMRVASAVRPIAVWGMAVLGLLGAAGLFAWPYVHACGMWLVVYLVGVLAVFGAAIWAMRAAWVARRGVAMILGMIILLASLTLATREVLPRIGYARTTLTWSCTT